MIFILFFSMRRENSMARRNISIEEKIERAKLKAGKAKDRCDEALSELKNLMEEKRKLQLKELMDAIDKSDRTYDVNFLNKLP